MRQNRIKAEPNIFQEIKKITKEAEAKGIKIWKLSIGQPSGPALESARIAACNHVVSDEEKWHEYQDNGCIPIPDFAKRFAQAHNRRDLSDKNLVYLPIPGIKPILGLIIQASGGIKGKTIRVGSTTNPGYPVPKTQCTYLNMQHYDLRTNPQNSFLFNPHNDIIQSDLMMVNYPHNPSGQIAHKDWWVGLCEVCAEQGIRLFNDAAYAMLANKDSITLAEVACDYPNLSWAEAYSASKSIGNGTGWRIGAMVGSKDFIEDITVIKGNTDSGFNAALAAGALHALECDKEVIRGHWLIYQQRLCILIGILKEQGMQLAVEPKAGFFTLWQTPQKAFGEKIVATQPLNELNLNELMIKNTGIVGVPFGNYIRYAVTSPIENKEWQEAIKNGFQKAQVSY